MRAQGGSAFGPPDWLSRVFIAGGWVDVRHNWDSSLSLSLSLSLFSLFFSHSSFSASLCNYLCLFATLYRLLLGLSLFCLVSIPQTPLVAVRRSHCVRLFARAFFSLSNDRLVLTIEGYPPTITINIHLAALFIGICESHTSGFEERLLCVGRISQGSFIHIHA